MHNSVITLIPSNAWLTINFVCFDWQLTQICNIQENNFQWKILEYKDNDDEDHQTNPSSDYLKKDSSYAYINNNPVCVQLIEKDDTYILKVSTVNNFNFVD